MKLVSLVSMMVLISSSSFAVSASVFCNDLEITEGRCPVVSATYIEAQKECNKQLLDVAQVRDARNNKLGFVCIALPLN